MTALLDNISKNTFFCGSFIDNKFSFTSKKNNKVSLLLNAFLIVADYPKKNRLLSIKNVYSIFKAHDFEIIDMTEINDVIYFTSKKI